MDSTDLLVIKPRSRFSTFRNQKTPRTLEEVQAFVQTEYVLSDVPMRIVNAMCTPENITKIPPKILLIVLKIFPKILPFLTNIVPKFLSKSFKEICVVDTFSLVKIDFLEDFRDDFECSNRLLINVPAS